MVPHETHQTHRPESVTNLALEHQLVCLYQVPELKASLAAREQQLEEASLQLEDRLMIRIIEQGPAKPSMRQC